MHLLWRQVPAYRVEDEVQLQTGAFLAVSKIIQLPQTLDTAIENPAASLHVNVLGRITWKRCHDVHLLIQIANDEHGQEYLGVKMIR